MCPNQFTRQQGFLIPLALFIVLGIGFLAITISRMGAYSSQSSVREGLSVQSFYTAESGVQFSLNQIFYNQTLRTVVDTNCANLSQTLSFNTAGLASCSANVACSCVGACSGSGTVSFYSITSAASCGSGNLVADRTIEVNAFFE